MSALEKDLIEMYAKEALEGLDVLDIDQARLNLHKILKVLSQAPSEK